MFNKYLLPFFCLVSYNVYATIRTVSNNPATIAQFSTLQAAINASATGDTVLVQGSPIQYAAFTLDNKALVILGPGFSPTKEIPYTATLLGATVIGATGTAGTEIQGMAFARENGSQLYVMTGNVRFVRNAFYGSIGFRDEVFQNKTCNNVVWEGNYFQVSDFSMNGTCLFSNWLFQNNLFYLPGLQGIFRSLNRTSNFLFNHNFIYSCSGSLIPIIHDASNFGGIAFTNNILFRLNLTASMGVTSYSNNLTFECNNNEPWLLPGNANGGGNIANTNPQLVSQAQIDACHVILDNLSVAAGPAKNAGSDGKDIGLMFDETGPYNWVRSRNALLPRIAAMSLPNAVIQQGGSLEVNLKAVKAN